MVIWNLKHTLDRRDMSQRELARLTGIRFATINAYTKGYADYISVEHINKICKALNCTLPDIAEFVPDSKLDKDMIID
jgi:putative transcriptional regulator